MSSNTSSPPSFSHSLLLQGAGTRLVLALVVLALIWLVCYVAVGADATQLAPVQLLDWLLSATRPSPAGA